MLLPKSLVFGFVVDLVSEVFLDKFWVRFQMILGAFLGSEEYFRAVGGVRLRRTGLESVSRWILKFLGGGWKPRVKK